MSSSYPKFAEDFSKDLMELLDMHHAVLEPALRQARPTPVSPTADVLEWPQAPFRRVFGVP